MDTAKPIVNISGVEPITSKINLVLQLPHKTREQIRVTQDGEMIVNDADGYPMAKLLGDGTVKMLTPENPDDYRAAGQYEKLIHRMADILIALLTNGQMETWRSEWPK